MRYYKSIYNENTNKNESVLVNSPEDATRCFINEQDLEKAKIVKNDSGQYDVDNAKLLALKAKIKFNGNIANSTNGNGVVIHKNAPKEDSFDLDAFLATS